MAHVLHIADLAVVTRPHTDHSASRPSGRGGPGLGAAGAGHRRLSTSGGPRPVGGARAQLPLPGASTRHMQRPLTVPGNLAGRRGDLHADAGEQQAAFGPARLLKSRGGPGIGPL